MLLICMAAFVLRASSGLLMILGTMRPARIPRITTTTIISMRVKP
jgi:predicted oxidoreductase